MLINKTDAIQRTSVKGIKTDIKPGEIFEPTEYEYEFLIHNYGHIFGKMERQETNEETNPLQTKKKKGV